MTTPSRPNIPNNLGWGIAGLLLFLPVGVFALIKAIKVNSALAAGDVAEAQANSEGAKKLGKIAVIVGAIGWVVICLFYIVLIALVASNSA